MEGVGADGAPAASVAAEIVAAGGVAIAEASDVSTAERSTSTHRRGDECVRTRRHPDQQRRNQPMGGLSGGRRRQSRGAPRRARCRFVQHRTRGMAAHGRAGLRPHRHDDLGGDLRTAREPLVRHREGRRHRAHAQPHDRRRRTASRSTPSPRRLDAHGRPARERSGSAAAVGAGARRTDGRLPRARDLPGQRRDLRGRRRSLRASSSRRPRVTSTPGPSRRSRTSPGTGQRSTTRPVTPSPPTSPPGPPHSWNTWVVEVLLDERPDER